MKTKLITFIFCSFFGSAIFAQTWTHIGPLKDNNPSNQFETGMANCLALDNGYDGITNKTIYAGSRSGGLWVTNNLGNNWSVFTIPDAVPFHGVSALERIPSTTKMFVATFNTDIPSPTRGGGIFILDLLSNTWTTTTYSQSPNCEVNDIGIFPGDANVVFAATTVGIFRSINGGLFWQLVRDGNFEKIEFVPVQTSTGLFSVFASGLNDIELSVNKGATFSSDPVLMAALGSTFYADMCATKDATTGKGLLYVDALMTQMSSVCTSPAAPTYGQQVCRVIVNPVTGAETYNNAGFLPECIAPSTDRMCVAANDQIVYFGNGGVAKYNFMTSNFYTPPPGSPDVITSSVSYGSWTGNTHSDLHDLLLAPNNQLLVLCDGGFYYDSYTPVAPGSQVYNNSWTIANNGLNISQIMGLSCSESNPDKFFTGEQDTKAFIVTGTSPVATSYGTEPSNIIIDRNNDNTFLYSTQSSAENIAGNYNGSPIAIPPALTYWDNTSSPVFCNPATNWAFPAAEFGSNTLYQDPNNPSRGIYYGIKGGILQEYCPVQDKFMGIVNLPGTTWQQYPNSLAFSKANKDKVYATTNSRNFVAAGDVALPQVYVYSGVNFDDSWISHNDTWTNISPALTDPVFPSGLATPAAYQMEFVGVVASDWNPDDIYMAVRYVPGATNLKVLKRSGGVWSDYSSGIPSSEIANFITYEQGTNDQMYLATNVNVYYRDKTMSQWILYTGNLPNIGMRQLRINYTENTLRVGTYGQGMWKIGLNCPLSTSIVVPGSISTNTFDEAVQFVSSQYPITNGSVKFRAGQYDLMTTGFEVTASSSTNFIAYIHNCSGSGNTFRMAHTDNPDLEMDDIEEKYEQQNPLNIYPNPNDGLFKVDYNIDEKTTGKIIVTDIIGNFVKTIPVTGEEHTIEVDLNAYKNGIYFINLYENNQLIKTQKTVISH